MCKWFHALRHDLIDPSGESTFEYTHTHTHGTGEKSLGAGGINSPVYNPFTTWLSDIFNPYLPCSLSDILGGQPTGIVYDIRRFGRGTGDGSITVSRSLSQ